MVMAMRVDCDVMLDVLPFYAEGMVSETTREITEAHLQQCESCSKALAEIKSAWELPAAFGKDSVKRMKRGNRRRKFQKWMWMLAALSLLMTILCSLVVLCTVPVWMTAGEAMIETEESVSNMIRVIAKGDHHGLATVAPSTAQTDQLTTAWGICYYKYRLDWIYKQPESTPYIAFEGQTLWYRGDLAAETDTLLLGEADNTLNTVIEAEKELGVYRYGNQSLIWVFRICLGTGTACLVVGVLLRKKRAGSLLLKAAVPLLCCCVACVFVTGGRMLSADDILSETGLLRRYAGVAAMTALYWATVSCILGIIK